MSCVKQLTEDIVSVCLIGLSEPKGLLPGGLLISVSNLLLKPLTPINPPGCGRLGMESVRTRFVLSMRFAKISDFEDGGLGAVFVVECGEGVDGVVDRRFLRACDKSRLPVSFENMLTKYSDDERLSSAAPSDGSFERVELVNQTDGGWDPLCVVTQSNGILA